MQNKQGNKMNLVTNFFQKKNRNDPNLRLFRGISMLPESHLEQDRKRPIFILVEQKLHKIKRQRLILLYEGDKFTAHLLGDLISFFTILKISM